MLNVVMPSFGLSKVLWFVASLFVLCDALHTAAKLQG